MKYLYLTLLLAIFTDCGGQQKKQTAPEAEEGQPARTFRMADVPAVITEPSERADYLVKHYWDHFDFSDTAYIHLPEVTEQAFADYLEIMPIASYPAVSASIKDMLRKAETDTAVYQYFTSLYEKYLYDANSPFRNDEYYIPALEYIISSPASKEKVRPTYLLELAKRNRPGQKATNFTYTLPDGKQSDLNSIQSDYIVLLFHNPGCNTCEEMIAQLKSSMTIDHLIKTNRLKILAVYPDDDLEDWKNDFAIIPKEWINAYDKSTRVIDKELYDLKAIPTVYLLDKDKKVILKDTTFEQLENYLRQLNG